MKKEEYKRMFVLEKDYWWYRGLHELVLKIIKNYSNSNKITLFDAGCGTGIMMELLNKFGKVDGIDYSVEAIKFSEKRGLKNIKVENLNNWNKKGKLYDVIICLDVLYHSGIKDDIETIRNFYSSLNNNGLLILNNPAFNVLRRSHDDVVFTKRRYRKSITIKKMKSIGFDIETATYRLPFLFFVILIRKTLNKFFTNKVDSDLVSIPNYINKLFLFINRIENKLIVSGINMPFGSSLFIVARKN
jgi:2-polyprenyl-3-methyl-5-hydroxy-6-metoxy-1,4-benzoquinol methylase